MGTSAFTVTPEQHTAALRTDMLNKTTKAIGSNETSIIPAAQKYSSSQDSRVKAYGRALGKYRVTEAELKAYAPHYLGRSVTPDEFLANPAVQDQYLHHKILHFTSQGYTPEQFADIHNKGLQHEGAPGSTTYQSPDYVKKFDATYKAPS